MPKKHGPKEPKSKQPKIEVEESQLFRETMRGIKPLAHNKITKKTPPPRKITQKITEEPDDLGLYESDYAENVGPDTLLEFHRDGLQHKILRNLRQGKYNVEAILDMHGMNTEKARLAVTEFLSLAKQQKLRYLLIIHGKGHGSTVPILKNKLNQWLRQIDFVLAFCSANPREGSGGAVYVLLNRR